MFPGTFASEMLYLIGAGLVAEHLTLKGLEAIKSCGKVYLECYTSKLIPGNIELGEFLGKKIQPLSREDVELKAGALIEEAKKEDVALLVVGDALTATTHTDLLLRAKNAGCETRVIPGVSIYTVAPGVSGLQVYKFGRSTTIVYPEPNYYPESPYEVVRENREKGLHTLCLLDVKAGKLMTAREGAKVLMDIAIKRGQGSEAGKWECDAVCSAGSELQKVYFGKLNAFTRLENNDAPQTLIVLGKLHELEIEFLEAFAEKIG